MQVSRKVINFFKWNFNLFKYYREFQQQSLNTFIIYDHLGIWLKNEDIVNLRQIDSVFYPNKEVHSAYEKTFENWKKALDRFKNWYWHTVLADSCFIWSKFQDKVKCLKAIKILLVILFVMTILRQKFCTKIELRKYELLWMHNNGIVLSNAPSLRK